MEIFTALPDWLAWTAAGIAGVAALATIAGVLNAVLDLEAG